MKLISYKRSTGFGNEFENWGKQVPKITALFERDDGKRIELELIETGRCAPAIIDDTEYKLNAYTQYGFKRASRLGKQKDIMLAMLRDKLLCDKLGVEQR